MTAPSTARERGPLRNVPAYAQIVRSRLRIAVTYRQNTFFMLAVVVVQIFVLHRVWTALYGDEGVVNGIALSDVLVYLTLANLQNWALQDSTISSYVHALVREGRIVFDILRPAGFVPQLIAHLTGGMLAMVLFAVAALPLVALAGTLALPVSLSAFGLWLFSLVCAFAVAILLNLLVSLCAFWTTEIHAFTLLVALTGQFFAGALVPLSFFPDFLRTLAGLLPFQATTYTPVAVYVGRLEGGEALAEIGIQCLWIVLLAAAVRQVWSRALHRVVVQGG